MPFRDSNIKTLLSDQVGLIILPREILKKKTQFFLACTTAHTVYDSTWAFERDERATAKSSQFRP